MQDIHIVCIPERVMLLVEELEAQLASADDAELLDWGYSCKKGQGYIVLEWVDEVDEVFVEQLNEDESVVDYCIYTLPTSDLPPGAELTVMVSQEEEKGESG